eukprot:1926439-Pyramimonas_sp.AAC.1
MLGAEFKIYNYEARTTRLYSRLQDCVEPQTSSELQLVNSTSFKRRLRLVALRTPELVSGLFC